MSRASKGGTKVRSFLSVSDLTARDLAGILDRMKSLKPAMKRHDNLSDLRGLTVGLFFEKPYISTVMGDPADVFLEGMVIGVECFLGRKGVGSAGFEQNAIITSTGVELITTTPMLW